jgi:hypothetical protein
MFGLYAFGTWNLLLKEECLAERLRLFEEKVLRGTVT